MFTQRHLIPLVAALVFTVTVALYWQTCDFEFLNYDDEDYVTCSVVTNGLTVANVKWAFTGATKATAN